MGFPSYEYPVKPPVVTICGSTRFRAEIAEANRKLTLAGYIVLAPGVFAHDGDEIGPREKEALDRLHRDKIDMSHSIYVVNPGGYIGDSTRNEIDYARSKRRQVMYLVDQLRAVDERAMAERIYNAWRDDGVHGGRASVMPPWWELDEESRASWCAAARAARIEFTAGDYQ